MPTRTQINVTVPPWNTEENKHRPREEIINTYKKQTHRGPATGPTVKSIKSGETQALMALVQNTVNPVGRGRIVQKVKTGLGMSEHACNPRTQRQRHAASSRLPGLQSETLPQKQRKDKPKKFN